MKEDLTIIIFLMSYILHLFMLEVKLFSLLVMTIYGFSLITIWSWISGAYIVK